MPDSAPSDSELLAAWLSHRHEPSFHALVSRYAGLVHMAARRTCGDDSLAAEASQLTFILLARKAGSLASRSSLAGWLHLTAGRQAKDLVRRSRREHRKLESLAMETTPHSTDDAWREMQPVLDDALDALSSKDREALLLRFYRVLSVREVAETLGIATDAAQKRIDRATVRLREKLARRGCQAGGGALSATLLAGFAADAQAAVPAVSVLATKAIATGAAGAGIFPSITALLTTTAMKSTSIAAPLVALLAAGAWLASQRHSIAELERQTAGLQSQLAGKSTVSSAVKRTTSIVSALDRKPIDWAEVARQLRAGEGDGFLQTGLDLKTRLQEGFAGMSIGELETSLDEIAVAGLSQGDLVLLEGTIARLLLEKDPERGLTRFIDRVHDDGSSPFAWILAPALGKWAMAEPAKADAWFDLQIAAGKFESRLVNGHPSVRYRFEHELTFVLLKQSPESAGRRLAAFPEDQRIKVLQGVDAGRTIYNDETLYRPFAEMLRQHLSDEDRLDVISWPLIDRGEAGSVEYTAMDEYFTRIGATPEEVDACILAVATEGRFPRENFFDTMPADLDTLRKWVAENSPKLVNDSTARALKHVLNLSGNNFPQWAHYVLRLHDAGAGDDVLISVIEAHNADDHKELKLKLVRQLSDGELRSRYLKQTQ